MLDELSLLCSKIRNKMQSPSFDHSTVTTGVVGQGKKQEILRIHKDLLCENSMFFAGCLSNGFIESNDGLVNLPEDEPAGMRMFSIWLYTSKITFEENGSQQFFEGYKLADKICAEKFSNALMDCLRAHLASKKKTLSFLCVKDLYHVGLGSKPAAKFAVGEFVHLFMHPGGNQEVATRMALAYSEPLELARNIMLAMLAFHREAWSSPEAREGCCYHEHMDGTCCG